MTMIILLKYLLHKFANGINIYNVLKGISEIFISIRKLIREVNL